MSKSDRNEMPTCGNCRFWDERHDGDGYCRRHAPRPMPEQMLTEKNGDLNRFTAFPVTNGWDWCGELVEIETE